MSNVLHRRNSHVLKNMLIRIVTLHIIVCKKEPGSSNPVSSDDLSQPAPTYRNYSRRLKEGRLHDIFK
nr:hypothetical protein [Tanacetum cinerariifolium]GFC01297.1 hypothetical protein [Tanacetum cinerariifolium]